MVSQYEHGPDFQTPNEAEIQRLVDTVDDLMAQLVRANAWIDHWLEDISAGLKPTRVSLTSLKSDIDVTLSKAKEA